MKAILNRLASVAIAALIVLMLVWMVFALRLVLEDPKKGLASSEAAGWVQAIGSVAAIFAAFTLGNKQAKAAHSSAINIQERQQMQQRAAFLAIVGAANENVQFVKSIFCGSTYEGFARFAMYKEETTEGVLRAMQGIPLHELGDAAAVTAWLRVTDQLRWILLYIEAFDAEIQPGASEHETLHVNRRSRSKIGRAIEDIEQNYSILIERLKTSI